MNFYTFHIGDYISNTHYLDLYEDLAYRRMMDLYYQKEEPLPNDIEKIAKMIRMREHIEAVESILNEFFILDDGVWRHTRCDAELAKIYEKSEKARASANARHSRNKSKPKPPEIPQEIPVMDDSADDLRTQCERSANGMLPITQYPIREIEIPHAPDFNSEPDLPDGCLSQKQVMDFLQAQGVDVMHDGFLPSHPDLQAACATGVTVGVLQFAWDAVLSKGKQRNGGYFFSVLAGKAVDAAAEQASPPTPQRQGRGNDMAAQDADLLTRNGVDPAKAMTFAQVRASKRAGLLTQAQIDFWKLEGKVGTLDMGLPEIVNRCLEKGWARFEAGFELGDKAVEQVKQAEADKARVVKQIKADVESRGETKPVRSGRPPNKLSDTLKQAQQANAEAAHEMR